MRPSKANQTAGAVLYETHMHTPLCKHAVGEPEEYAQVAQHRGLRGIQVTCHNPMPNHFSANVRMRIEEFDQYVELVQRSRDAWRGRIDVRLGLEADYFPGYEKWLEDQLSWADFHYVLGSIHPQTFEFQRRYWQNDAVAFQRVYFDLLAQAAETELFDCLAHPDLVKNSTPTQWNPQLIMDDVRRALDRIARTSIAMELNTSGANKVVAEMNPFPAMLAEMHKRQIPVVVGADAHEPERVGERFEQALDLLETVGYESISLFLERKRHEIPIVRARASLRRP